MVRTELHQMKLLFKQNNLRGEKAPSYVFTFKSYNVFQSFKLGKGNPTDLVLMMFPEVLLIFPAQEPLLTVFFNYLLGNKFRKLFIRKIS